MSELDKLLPKYTVTDEFINLSGGVYSHKMVDSEGRDAAWAVNIRRPVPSELAHGITHLWEQAISSKPDFLDYTYDEDESEYSGLEVLAKLRNNKLVWEDECDCEW